MKKREAFTLIELVAVLVILAILALIVTPLVLNIIKKARTSADKRSIDAYGRSIELAIADYLLDKGEFPTSIDQLTIEYTGDKVECSNKGLNEDGTIYLTDCTVNGRTVTGYAYGKTEEEPEYKAYSLGDELTYNNVNYYVIKNSDKTKDTVTLLKAEPLTVEEVNQYGGVGTDNNHVNMYATPDINASYYHQAYNENGYGGMQYYSSSTCTNYGPTGGCISSYNSSEVKYVVDAWKNAKVPVATEARLITTDELTQNLGYEIQEVCTGSCYNSFLLDNVPSWVYNNNYYYWTMSPANESLSSVWHIKANGDLSSDNINSEGYGVVRPVIVLSKSALN